MSGFLVKSYSVHTGYMNNSIDLIEKYSPNYDNVVQVKHIGHRRFPNRTFPILHDNLNINSNYIRLYKRQTFEILYDKAIRILSIYLIVHNPKYERILTKAQYSVYHDSIPQYKNYSGTWSSQKKECLQSQGFATFIEKRFFIKLLTVITFSKRGVKYYHSVTMGAGNRIFLTLLKKKNVKMNLFEIYVGILHTRCYI